MDKSNLRKWHRCTLFRLLSAIALRQTAGLTDRSKLKRRPAPCLLGYPSASEPAFAIPSRCGPEAQKPVHARADMTVINKFCALSRGLAWPRPKSRRVGSEPRSPAMFAEPPAGTPLGTPPGPRVRSGQRQSPCAIPFATARFRPILDPFPGTRSRQREIGKDHQLADTGSTGPCRAAPRLVPRGTEA